MHDLKVILYSSNLNGAAARLGTVISSVAAQHAIRLCRTVESLRSELCLSGSNEAVAVLLASGEQDLAGIISIRNILINARVIIILPDGRRDTMARAHSIYPRFVSYMDSDFSDVGTVLDTILKRSVRFSTANRLHESDCQ